jgi:hypothetical protein
VERRRSDGEAAATRGPHRAGRRRRPARLPLDAADPIEDTAYLAALVAGKQVSAIACERPGVAQVFCAKSLDEVREWAAYRVLFAGRRL